MNLRKQKLINIILSFLLVLSILISPIYADAASKTTVNKSTKAPVVKIVKPVEQKKVRNVIFMLGDGMGISHTTLSRWYKGSNLAMDEIVTGLIRTYGADSVITDSAPAATAFACGVKSDDKFIGVYPDKITVPTEKAVDEKDAYKPLANVLEGAKLLGKSTGLVSTCQTPHASPAGFSSHVPNRSLYYDIAMQQVYQGIDVVFGGGKQYLVSNVQNGRKDGNNLIEVLKNMGYDFVEDTQAMRNTKANKVWGMFADDSMDFDMDRDPAKQPSLLEMTQKSINILNRNKKGFFLFVEGSEIDWASHANDPIGVIGDTLAFDKAVKYALDFAKMDGNTLVIVVSDHDNGGLSIGNSSTNSTYSSLPLSRVVDPLKKAKYTANYVEKLLNADRSNIVEVMRDYYGITDLTQDEIDAIKNAKSGSFNYVVGPIISKRASIGWTTTGHAGTDVALYAYGPYAPKGLVQNTDLANVMAKAMGFDLKDVNDKLFIDIEKGINLIPNATSKLDTTNAANPVLEITKGNIKAQLPINTNILKIGDKQYKLKGITILSKNKRVYVSKEALDIIYGAK
ncbi:alkaline phosphatase [Caloramator quimbayensis]|uniref:Alkaline phosphatase n=1 Tax=Caloramator quimbayensis TaxID=1147123 RepID=A0A1T4YBV8_9CLOT|nr:alkaline phosphatase [Caloramator quimbayensis]SKA98998.1 alkaline phosphatase [Caloramator quimbayensis]